VVSEKKYSFDASCGRIICSTCSLVGKKGLDLSHGTLNVLRRAQDLPLERLHRLSLSGTILREALNVLHAYGRHLFQRDIISWRLMQTYCNHPSPGKSNHSFTLYKKAKEKQQ
jgi:DNA repair protein RecO (recombination protein O)